MTRPAVLVLSRWTGYCLPCNASDRPLVLVWSGDADLRTRLLGPADGTGVLRLTCGLCGGTDVVGWEDEHVDEALLRDDPVEEVAAAVPGAVPVAVPAVVAEVDLEASRLDPAEPVHAHHEQAVTAVPDSGPGLDLLAELIGDDEPAAPAWEPPLSAEPVVAWAAADDEVLLPVAADEETADHAATSWEPGAPVAWDDAAAVEPGALWRPVDEAEAVDVEPTAWDASDLALPGTTAWDPAAPTVVAVEPAAWEPAAAHEVPAVAPDAVAPAHVAVDASVPHLEAGAGWVPVVEPHAPAAWQPEPAHEPAPAAQEPAAAVAETAETAEAAGTAEPAEPAWVPSLSADVAAALRDLGGPVPLPAPRNGAESSPGLIQHG